MARLKFEHEKQLERKGKRQEAFDATRGIEHTISERNRLREISKTLRSVLTQLAKWVANCKENLNATLEEEIQKIFSENSGVDEHDIEKTLNSSRLSASVQLRAIPNVCGLLELVEDPNLMQFIDEENVDNTCEEFGLKECLQRLNTEALYLLKLSEDLRTKRNAGCSSNQSSNGDEDERVDETEKQDSCCEDVDGYKIAHSAKLNHSFREYQANFNKKHIKEVDESKVQTSLPTDFLRISSRRSSCSGSMSNLSELNVQLTELKNRLVKSESDRRNLQHQLENTIKRNTELGQELQSLRDQLSQTNSLSNVEYIEGYGQVGVEPAVGLERASSSFMQLQDKARSLLSSPNHNVKSTDSTLALLQMIEEFCREGDKIVESSRKERDDLQAQIAAADKHLKSTRQFLEEQASEREQERDEFLREIETLKAKIREKEREASSHAYASEELKNLMCRSQQYAQLEQQLKEAKKEMGDVVAKKGKFEVELKASIDKVFVLREIISDLEIQVETKALNERVLEEKVKQLEEFVSSQNAANETLEQRVNGLETDIADDYQQRIRMLEEKLKNMRPSEEQSIILDNVVEQLRGIEQTLDQKIKTLESVYQSNTSSSCSTSVTEDVSMHGARPTEQRTDAADSTEQASPHQHSFTMDSVQRIIDKLEKHSRVEGAAVKRIRDLETQLNQLRTTSTDLQIEREVLQEHIDEQTKRINNLQSRIEQQRQYAEDLNRANTTHLEHRVADLRNEVLDLKQRSTAFENQNNTLQVQLQKSGEEISRLEKVIAMNRDEPERNFLEQLKLELIQKDEEIKKLREKLKTEIISRLALPNLMDDVIGDKNDEIELLRHQLLQRDKEMRTFMESNNISSLNSNIGDDGTTKAVAFVRATSTKLSGRTQCDMISISELEEPEVARRAALLTSNTTLSMPEDCEGFTQKTMETFSSTGDPPFKRNVERIAAAELQPINTFENLNYFQHPILTQVTQSDCSSTPGLMPRHINFSQVTDESAKTKGQKVLNSSEQPNTTNYDLEALRAQLAASKTRIEALRNELEIYRQKTADQLQNDAEQQQLQTELQQLKRECTVHTEQLTKQQKELQNYSENEEQYIRRITKLEADLLEQTSQFGYECSNLRKELCTLNEIHKQCKHTLRDADERKREIEHLNREIKEKDDLVRNLTTHLSFSEECCTELKRRIASLEQEIEQIRQQSHEGSTSKQLLSVDEIAKRVEKELNYSAELDSNILKAIESEEENNLDKGKEKRKKSETQGTDDENFVGERELLNQLEALKAQLIVECEQVQILRKDLGAEKLHSQDIQEQDVLIIEAMRKRLEAAVEKEDKLLKQLDLEREHCQRLQTQLTSLQRAESRRNSSSLMKSPTDSPKKSPRSDFEMEVGERLRSEIKLLSSQIERERERSADLQRNGERERQRFETELRERIEYGEHLKKEMEKVARDKESAEQEVIHFQERLNLQSAEVESLEARLVALQEAETRRSNRTERQHKENARLLAELEEIHLKLKAAECERVRLSDIITQLRFDVERSSARETQLTNALKEANEKLLQHTNGESVPRHVVKDMKEISDLLTKNIQDNRQMDETIQYLVTERSALQKKCTELELQLNNGMNAAKLEERCKQLLARYLRAESYRKALIYQKRYLKKSLESYQENERRGLMAVYGMKELHRPARDKKKLFKTAALSIIAIQRMKFIKRAWSKGKAPSVRVKGILLQDKQPAISCSDKIVTNNRNTSQNIASPLKHTPPRHMNNRLPLQEALPNDRGNKLPALASIDWSVPKSTSAGNQ